MAAPLIIILLLFYIISLFCFHSNFTALPIFHLYLLHSCLSVCSPTLSHSDSSAAFQSSLLLLHLPPTLCSLLASNLSIDLSYLYHRSPPPNYTCICLFSSALLIYYPPTITLRPNSCCLSAFYFNLLPSPSHIPSPRSALLCSRLYDMECLRSSLIDMFSLHSL